MNKYMKEIMYEEKSKKNPKKTTSDRIKEIDKENGWK